MRTLLARVILWAIRDELNRRQQAMAITVIDAISPESGAIVPARRGMAARY